MNAAEETLPENLPACSQAALRFLPRRCVGVTWTSHVRDLVYVHARRNVRSMVSGKGGGNAEALPECRCYVRAAAVEPEAVAVAGSDVCPFRRIRDPQIDRWMGRRRGAVVLLSPGREADERTRTQKEHCFMNRLEH